MKKQFLIPFLLLSFSLFSIEQEKSKLCENISFDLGGGAGYRQDWHDLHADRRNAYSGTFFKQDFDNLHAVITELWGKLLFYNVQIFIQTDYGWVRSGDLKTTLNIIDNPDQPLETFKSDVSGDLFDTRGSLAYQLNLWKKNCNRFAIVPEGGFSLHHQSLRQKNTRPKPFVALENFRPFVNQVDTILDLSIRRLKRTWWGPFAGGSLLGVYKWFEGQAGYLYHWLKLSQTNGYQTQSNFFVFGNLFAQTLTSKFTSDETFDGKYSHEFFASLTFKVLKHFKIALRGNYMVAKSKREKTKFKIESVNQEFLPPPGRTIFSAGEIQTKTSNKWETFSILLDLILAF